MAGLAIGLGANLISGLIGSHNAKKAAKVLREQSDVAQNDIARANIAGNQAIGAVVGQGQAGVSTAVGQGQEALSKAVAQGQESNDIATAGAINRVDTTAGEANKVLGTNLAAQQENLSPYQALGSTGAAKLTDIINKGFALPTAEEVQKTPGFQFQLGEGLKGIQQQAAASGALQTGGTLKALTQYGQGVASTYYQNAVENALKAYGANRDTALAGTNAGLTTAQLYNQAVQNASNRQAENLVHAGDFAGVNTIENARYKSDLGFKGAGTAADLGFSGATTNAYLGFRGASEQSSNTINDALNRGNLRIQAAGGQAASLIGSANAWNSAIGGAANSLADWYFMRDQKRQASSSFGGFPSQFALENP